MEAPAKAHPMKTRTCLLCPNKAAPGCALCTACYHQQFPPIRNPRICPPHGKLPRYKCHKGRPIRARRAKPCK
jgi:hypothetical protein